MMLRKLIFTIVFILSAVSLLAAQPQQEPEQESDQTIGDFSLAGYGEKGKKTWDLSGKSADIFTDTVKLKKVTGNLYGEEEDVRLTAERGDFNKTDGKVHMEENVVITTTSGTKLTTDSMDWDRKSQTITTPDVVNIERENMVTVGRGAVGKMALKQVNLKEDVRVDLLPQAKEGAPVDPKEKIVITCDGSLEVDYEKNIATFNNNVKVDRTDSLIYCDKMTIYFLAASQEEKEKKLTAKKEKADSATQAFMGSKIDKIIARGNVKVVRGENVSYSEEAVYSATDQKLILTGRPKLVINSMEGMQDASFGD